MGMRFIVDDNVLKIESCWSGYRGFLVAYRMINSLERHTRGTTTLEVAFVFSHLRLGHFGSLMGYRNHQQN